MMRISISGVALLALMFASAPAWSAAGERDCLAAIAVLEAAGEGEKGMRAVIRVVRNRMADTRFPATACEVVRQPGQFQPVSEWPKLKQALDRPAAFRATNLLRPSASLDTAMRLAAGTIRDDTGGALYFVNPLMMDRRNCPWFSRLKRTTRIGAHVFMTHYAATERRGEPALDCSSPEIGSMAGRSLAKRYANGLFDPKGARTATRTPTRKQLEAWRRTGKLEARQKALKKHFKPGWIVLD